MKAQSKNTQKDTGKSLAKSTHNQDPFGPENLHDYELDDETEEAASGQKAEEQLMEDLKQKEAEGHELTQILGMVAITHEATEAMALITQKNRTIEDVTAEAETAKAENEALKKQLDKEGKLIKARAKCLKMTEVNIKLLRIEEMEKHIEEFETGREGQEATFELSNKAGQKFKTGNTYLVEAVIVALKAEIEKKKEELGSQLADLL
jgi:hypothetical protein